MPSWAWVVTGYEIVNTLFTDVSMPSWAWVVTTFKKVSRQNYDVSMPSRAWVVTYNGRNAGAAYSFQCPLGLELLPMRGRKHDWYWCFNALSGLSCYAMTPIVKYAPFMFQCPLGLELLRSSSEVLRNMGYVSMPSWAWVVTLTIRANQRIFIVSMPSWAYTSFLRSETVNWLFPILCVNALMGLYLISTKKNYEKWICYETVSMPSRAYTSFLRYPFKNLGFMRFPEPVFAGIYQNILTTTVFRAC